MLSAMKVVIFFFFEVKSKYEVQIRLNLCNFFPLKSIFLLSFFFKLGPESTKSKKNVPKVCNNVPNMRDVIVGDILFRVQCRPSEGPALRTPHCHLATTTEHNSYYRFRTTLLWFFRTFISKWTSKKKKITTFIEETTF